MDKDLLGSCFETACSLTTTIKAAKAAQMKASKVDAGNAGIKQ